MDLIGGLKRALKLRALLNGLKLRLGFPSQRLALNRLASSLPEIRLVIDVGADVGEFSALALQFWPAARVLAIEPRPPAVAQFRQRFADHPGVQIQPCLLGASSGEVLRLKCAETASSVLDEHQPLAVPVLEMAATTLDHLLHELGIEASSALLKIDVQGAEFAVLQGARKTLRGVRAVLVEMSLIDIHRGVPLAHEVMALLAEQGFVLFELSDLIRRPLEGALWQIEGLFVRTDDALRSNKNWQ